SPVTYFHANYSYTSNINTLQVPIEAKIYFVNGKRLNLYTALGASGMFVISEQTNLSIIKENNTNNLSYNQVNTSKFNALLMFGLGGDVRLYKKLYFTVDGGFRYGAMNLSNTTGITTNPTYFSVNGGLKIKL
ncbi:MAG TPA: outer membrane beta-barrel protein, partial [Bacteroidia bacterium]|nr:outer membrane beta-barrel protein [Bacteroidia bacterium]